MLNDNLSVKFSGFSALGQQPLPILLALLVTAVTACVPVSPSPTVAAPTPTATDIAPIAMATVASPITLVATATNSLPTLVPPATSPAEEVETEGAESGAMETTTNQNSVTMMETNQMHIQIGERVLTATLVDNTSVDALNAALAKGPITINMRDYAGMEKVGPLGMDLPRNDEQITTEAGDIILYQGNAFVIYYAQNAWSLTRLGKVDEVSATELKEILGDGNVTVTLSLPSE